MHIIFVCILFIYVHVYMYINIIYFCIYRHIPIHMQQVYIPGMYGCGGKTSTNGLTPWESNINVGNVQGIKKCAQH